MYPKKKTYPGRWVVKLVESMLVFSIILFLLNAVLATLLPMPPHSRHAIVIHSVQTVDVHQNAMNMEPETAFTDADYFYMAYDHQTVGEYYDAIADYTRALEINPDLFSVYLNRGVAYEQLQNDYRAIQDYSKFLMRPGMMVITPPANRGLLTGARLDLSMAENYMYQIHFYAQSGQSLDISAVSKVEGLVDPIILVTDIEGTPITGRDDVLRPDGSFVSMDSYIRDFHITKTGHYILLVSHAGGGSDGALRVELSLDR